MKQASTRHLKKCCGNQQISDIRYQRSRSKIEIEIATFGNIKPQKDSKYQRPLNMLKQKQGGGGEGNKRGVGFGFGKTGRCVVMWYGHLASASWTWIFDFGSSLFFFLLSPYPASWIAT